MAKKLFLVAVMVAAAGIAFAGPADNFKAGGMEFGGNMMYTYYPESAIFSSNTTKQEKGKYFQALDIEADVGYFPIDNLSLCLLPSVYWSSDHYLDGNLVEILEDDVIPSCVLNRWGCCWLV